jgi:hypothetical protein
MLAPILMMINSHFRWKSTNLEVNNKLNSCLGGKGVKPTTIHTHSEGARREIFFKLADPRPLKPTLEANNDNGYRRAEFCTYCAEKSLLGIAGRQQVVQLSPNLVIPLTAK